MPLYHVACHVETACVLVSMKCIKLKQYKLCHKTTVYCILLSLWQQNPVIHVIKRHCGLSNQD